METFAEIFALIGCPILGVLLSFVWLVPRKKKEKPSYRKGDLET